MYWWGHVNFEMEIFVIISCWTCHVDHSQGVSRKYSLVSLCCLLTGSIVEILTGVVMLPINWE